MEQHYLHLGLKASDLTMAYSHIDSYSLHKLKLEETYGNLREDK